MCQYPVQKRRLTRTITNETWDGRNVKLADPAGGVTEWQLRLVELTDGELAALQQFFQSVEGRLGSFTFLDPTGNLLSWSENLDEPVWEKDPLLTVTGDIGDPFGTSRAFQISNPSAAVLQIRQTLSAPGWFSYCFSVYARSSEGGRVSLFRGTDSAAYELTTEWKRLVFSGQSQSTAESVAFGLEAGAGGSAEVFGMQVDAQIAPSLYRKTSAASGVYTDARFREDLLTITSDGLDQHSCVLNVLASR